MCSLCPGSRLLWNLPDLVPMRLVEIRFLCHFVFSLPLFVLHGAAIAVASRSDTFFAWRVCYITRNVTCFLLFNNAVNEKQHTVNEKNNSCKGSPSINWCMKLIKLCMKQTCFFMPNVLNTFQMNNSKHCGKTTPLKAIGSVACNTNTFYLDVFNSCVFRVTRTFCTRFTRLEENYYFSCCNLRTIRPTIFVLSEVWNKLPVCFTEEKQ